MNTDLKIIEDFISKHPYAAAHAIENLDQTEVIQFIKELPFEKGV